ncbi:hypothetical protein KSZ_73800 [Dictyobacter formicarum]|uniref:DUF899 domain-containing protein n=2 Tax=Dictyobacter formicarum TaxID=2778368 RepID=A0ABQ3VUK7_9CHLR|nr:hypothetical protein KSZ_73800 [Dictyobacter formicarum]
MTQTRDNQHFTTTFLVDQTPEEVFNAVINVRGWWSQAIEGRTDQLGAQFTYHYQDVHRCAFNITEFVPGKKVVWHVVDNSFSFVKDKNEWIGTDVVFETARKGDQTEVHFTHVGLVPAYECYDVCSDAWSSYITKSLRDLITTGKGQPNPLEKIVRKVRHMEAIMKDESKNAELPGAAGLDTSALPAVVDRATWQAELDKLRVQEKAHTRQGDAIAAARRRLPMVEVDPTIQLLGPHGPVTLLEAFEGRRLLIAYYHMWHTGQPAAAQCEGCTKYNGQVRELSYLHSRDVTYATFCQGPYEESIRYRDFMGWDVPWYSVQDSADKLLAGRQVGMFYLVCYLRHGDRVFETYWTNGRGVEVMSPSYGLLDMTVYGRQETWEDSPAGWPQRWGENTSEPNAYRTNGRPIAQWSRLAAGRSDDLGTGTTATTPHGSSNQP